MGHQLRVAAKCRLRAAQCGFIALDAARVRRPDAFTRFADRLVLRIQVLPHRGNMRIFRAAAVVSPRNGRIGGTGHSGCQRCR